MPVIEVTTYDIVCDYPGCFESLDNFEQEENAISTAASQGWENDGCYFFVINI